MIKAFRFAPLSMALWGAAFWFGVHAQGVPVQPVKDPAAQAAAAQALSAAQAAQATANAAATPASVSSAISTATTGLVKSVQTIGPDANGNVNGLATSSQLTTVSSQLSSVMIAGDLIQVATPTSGATITPSNGVTVLLVNLSGLIAALTVAMPSNPVDGQRFLVSAPGGITLLSLTGGTIKGGASLSLSGYARFIYSANVGAWFRTG